MLDALEVDSFNLFIILAFMSSAVGAKLPVKLELLKYTEREKEGLIVKSETFWVANPSI